MNSLHPSSLPLEYVAEILFELSQLRDECVSVARSITRNTPINETALEDCARLDDALAIAQTEVRSALLSIKESRNGSAGK